MFNVRFLLQGSNVGNLAMPQLPKHGDTVRLSNDRHFKVVEVIWCMDQSPNSAQGQRIDILLMHR